MEKLIHGVHHVALKCENLEQYLDTIQFYVEILGLEPVRRWGEGDSCGAMLAAGDCLIEVFATGRTSEETGAVNHFAFAVKDVDACIEAVRECGYPITTEPKDIVIRSETPYPARIAFCRGPVGEEIEFFCEK